MFVTSLLYGSILSSVLKECCIKMLLQPSFNLSFHHWHAYGPDSFIITSLLIIILKISSASVYKTNQQFFFKEKVDVATHNKRLQKANKLLGPIFCLGRCQVFAVNTPTKLS